MSRTFAKQLLQNTPPHPWRLLAYFLRGVWEKNRAKTEREKKKTASSTGPHSLRILLLLKSHVRPQWFSNNSRTNNSTANYVISLIFDFFVFPNHKGKQQKGKPFFFSFQICTALTASYTNRKFGKSAQNGFALCVCLWVCVPTTEASMHIFTFREREGGLNRRLFSFVFGLMPNFNFKRQFSS